MTPLCAERVLQLHCYAAACRQRRAWRRLLQSAPVYVCTAGCGSTREVHELGRRAPIAPRPSEQTLIRLMRVADYSFDLAESRRAAGFNRHQAPVAAAPYCGCCGAACLVVRDSPVRRCHCDPFSESCPTCTRGACHCRCSRRGAASTLTPGEPCAQ